MDKMTKGDNLLVNEFNNLHDGYTGVCNMLIKSIGGTICSSPKNIFFVPVLSGTTDLEKYITSFAYIPLRLPLRLLDEKDSIEIGKKLNLFDNNYVNLNPYFR